MTREIIVYGTLSEALAAGFRPDGTLATCGDVRAWWPSGSADETMRLRGMEVGRITIDSSFACWRQRYPQADQPRRLQGIRVALWSILRLEPMLLIGPESFS